MNRLAGETSPYLLQHADNPVDWYPWGEEALARAREEDRPILLSIGYAACHWCHVMEHESFEDEETARIQNEHFVNVKVDREERPDLDAIYMDAVVTLTGHGGWPLTAFLTPEGEPFYGGTYFPPEPRHGLPSFRQVLEAVSSAYRERRADVGRSAGQLVEAIERAGRRAAVVGAAHRVAARRGRARAARRRSIPSGAASAARRSSRRTRCSSSCCAEASWRWPSGRSTGWRPAACTTSSVAVSTATPWTSAGSSRTSRRCSTTTRSSSPRISTRGSSPAASATGRSSRRPWSTCSATSCCPTARSRRRRTPTPTVSRG